MRYKGTDESPVFSHCGAVCLCTSVTLRSERMKNALTIWLIWRDSLVRSGMASSRSACVSLRYASFHIDWQSELDFYLSIGRAGETSRDTSTYFERLVSERSAFLPFAQIQET